MVVTSPSSRCWKNRVLAGPKQANRRRGTRRYRLEASPLDVNLHTRQRSGISWHRLLRHRRQRRDAVVRSVQRRRTRRLVPCRARPVVFIAVVAAVLEGGRVPTQPEPARAGDAVDNGARQAPVRTRPDHRTVRLRLVGQMNVMVHRDSQVKLSRYAATVDAHEARLDQSRPLICRCQRRPESSEVFCVPCWCRAGR